MAAVETTMEIDNGGQVWARHTCPHVLQSVTMPDVLDSFPDLATSTECNKDDCQHTESWVCMGCHQVLCGRYGNQHMIHHKNEKKSHCIAMGTGDLSFWCYGCDDYLDHLHIRRIFEFYKIAHVKKFHHEIQNIEKLMERTDFTKQDQLETDQLQREQQNDDHKEQKSNEKAVELEWFKGTEILKRKWAKKDEIEYDSDPEHKQKDNKSHIHKGIILKVTDAGQFGKIMVKDNDGGYVNYSLETIAIKLPPATPENTVTKSTTNKSNLYTPSSSTTNTSSSSKKTKKPKAITSPSYDYSQYRGYDEEDDYEGPMEYVSYQTLKYRKRSYKKGDEIEYNSDPEDIVNKDSHIRKGKLIAMDLKKKALRVKLNTGQTVDSDLDKILIGIPSLFWQCGLCGFKNAVKTKKCMVCQMWDIEIKDINKRPPKQSEKKEPETKDNDDNEVNSNDDNKHNDVIPDRFFVYGTLRDDDDSGAIWTASWTHGCTASNGKLYGYKMYQQRGLNYPFAVKTGNMKDFIVGRIVTWNSKQIVAEKRHRADSIEGYREGDKDSLFHREVVQVENTDTDNAQKVKALFYFQDAPPNLHLFCKEMPNGDWLQRPR